ncbi:MAG: hypothetical protein U0L04_11915, partial [Bacteroidaceae bacterium]|nr:hypothetical protein [Bacteroidaceae bacterium]
VSKFIEFYYSGLDKALKSLDVGTPTESEESNTQTGHPEYDALFNSVNVEELKGMKAAAETARGYLQDGMTVEDLNRSLYNKEFEYRHAETDYGKGLDGMFTQIRNFLNMVKKGQ